MEKVFTNVAGCEVVVAVPTACRMESFWIGSAVGCLKV
jgi:hypothetical protein